MALSLRLRWKTAKARAACGQQQRSRCGIGMKKMQIKRALVAGTGSTMLPASQKLPKLAFFLLGPRARSSASMRVPRGGIVALVLETGGHMTSSCVVSAADCNARTNRAAASGARSWMVGKQSAQDAQ